MRKQIFLILVLIAYYNSMFGQLSLGKISVTSLIENAVSDGIIEVRTDYQLKDLETGDLYGRNGMESFGSGYCFGVLTEKGIIMPEVASKPWSVDPEFDKYKNSTKYSPVVSQREYRTFDNIVINGNANYNTVFLRDSICIIDKDSTNGFSLADSICQSEIYVIWILQNQGKTWGEAGSHTLSAQIKQVDSDKLEHVSFNVPLLMQQPLGGYVFVCKNQGIGLLRFELVGMLEKQNDEFKLFPYILSLTDTGSKTDEGKDREIKEESTDKDNGKLTPIKKR